MRLSLNHRRPRRREDRVSRPPSIPSRDFWSHFNDLLATRSQYDALRSADGSLLERSILQDRLHEIRHELARSRANS